MKFDRINAMKILVGVFVFSLIWSGQYAQAITTAPRSGIFDCVKAKGIAKKGNLVKAINKNPELKTDSDWFNSYILARLYTGYPNCFSKADVATMRKYVSAINAVCSNDPKWGSACLVAGSGRFGPLAWWAYGNG